MQALPPNINTRQPGSATFAHMQDAMGFAKVRVEESWIVHCYYRASNAEWIVEWWAY